MVDISGINDSNDCLSMTFSTTIGSTGRKDVSTKYGQDSRCNCNDYLEHQN